MKYPLFILLFCLACSTAKKAQPEYRFSAGRVIGEVTPYQPGEYTRVGQRENGTFVYYHEISQDTACCPDKIRVGYGRIYAINGVMQTDTAHYYFFNRRQ